MKVSVIIPVYNRPVLVLRALESVVNQTYRDFEIIIIDDGSTDRTVAVIREYLASNLPADLALKLIEVEHSGMPGKSRNLAAAEARGDFLAFLDSDDLWLPDKLTRQLKTMQEQKVRFSHTEEIWIRGGKQISQTHRKHPRRGDLFAACLQKCVIGPSTVILENSLFTETGGFREDLEICEDYEYWLRLASEHPVGWCDQFLTIKHGGHEDQLSGKYGQIEIFHITALKDLVEKGFAAPSQQKAACAVLAEKCARYAGGCRKRGRIDEALEYENLAASLK